MVWSGPNTRRRPTLICSPRFNELRISAKNAARPWGFTLVELLTVIAIIAVLATLTSASLSNAQRKGRKAVSISNLRQIALAFNLYLDDREKRPDTFRAMTETKYISERVLLCPEDRIVKNWAGVLENSDTGRKHSGTQGTPNIPTTPGNGDTLSNGESSVVVFLGDDVPHSYFKSFDYYDEIWERIDKNAMAGLAACQLHGIGRQQRDRPPSIEDFQGLVLRALKDGSVINRQVFWSETGFATSNNGSGPDAPASMFPGTGTSQLPLFVDPSE